MSQILVSSDYERKGSVYFYDKKTGHWFGHQSSVSRWVRWVRAPIILENELRKKALDMGYCPTNFMSRPKFSDVVNKKAKRKNKSIQKKSDSFIPLF